MDNFPITEYGSEAFVATLMSDEMVIPCKLAFSDERYHSSCSIPDVGVAGMWDLDVTVADELIESSRVRMHCPEGRFDERVADSER